MLKVYKPKVLITLPRSGSTWFSNCIFPPEERDKHAWEYFNPVNNSKTSYIIGGNRLWWHLLAPLKEYHEKFLMDMLYKDDARCIKECWGIAKMDFFNQHFKCLALVRDTKYTMPGLSDSRVNFHSFVAYYASLIYHKENLPDYREAIDFMYFEAKTEDEKLCAAHVIMSGMLRNECKKRNIPVFEYDKIVSLGFEDLKNYLKMDDEVISKILDTRNPRVDSTPFDELGIDDFIESLKIKLP